MLFGVLSSISPSTCSQRDSLASPSGIGVTWPQWAHQRAIGSGFEHAYMLQSASPLGVRYSRRWQGVRKLPRSQWPQGVALEYESGVSPSVSPKFPIISAPYGCLAPVRLDSLVVCGHRVSNDPNSHGFMREIPQCWLTGQAARVTAAAAAAANAATQS